MRSLILSATTAVIILTAVVPGALAADPSPTGTPTEVEEPTPTPGATGPYDGTIVVDPTFVSGGVLPTQRPGNPGTQQDPGLTPPPTDAPVATVLPDAELPAPMLILVSCAVLALAARPRPASRRRTRQA